MTATTAAVGSTVTYVTSKGTRATGTVARLVERPFGHSYVVTARNGVEVHVAEVTVVPAPRFTVVMRPATMRANDTLCVFRAGVIDTDSNRIVYVANRAACRDFAKRLNAEFAPGQPTDLAGESFPLHAAYATDGEAWAAERELLAAQATRQAVAHRTA